MCDPLDTTPAGGCSVQEGLARLVHLLPRVMRGLRRGAPATDGALGPRHRAALTLLRLHGFTAGGLAGELGLTLPTVSGLVADLERVGFVERRADPTDRRRTLVSIVEERRGCVDAWLEGTNAPLARVLERLSPEERETFVKALGYLDSELADPASITGRSSRRRAAVATTSRLNPGRGDSEVD